MSPFASTVLSTEVSVPAWMCAIAAIIGTVGISFMQLKKGTNIWKTVGKIICGFGVGFYMGSKVALTFGLDQLAGSFMAALCFQSIMQGWEEKFRKPAP